MSDWKIFKGAGTPHDGIQRLPGPPPWRDFQQLNEKRGETFQASQQEIDLVNAALYLRRPLLVTGLPGSGKSSLAYAVARELKLGRVLRWSINSRSTLQEGLYNYDAVGRLRDANLARGERDQTTYKSSPLDIGRYLRLGPLGTALLPYRRPRVLLIDEIDKSDIDLPNDLLHVFEEGTFEIPELVRCAKESPEVHVLTADGEGEEDSVLIVQGKIRCEAFPFVLLTSNEERELPPAFYRRCLRLRIDPPSPEKLRTIIKAHLNDVDIAEFEGLLRTFVEKRKVGEVLATDQLLNAIFLVRHGRPPEGTERDEVLHILLRELGST